MIGTRVATSLFIGGLALLALSTLVGSSPVLEANGATATPFLDLVDQGQALYRAKSCTTCHEPGLYGAPNLRQYDPDPAFLRSWLRDPDAVRPGTAMPNLSLDETEIEALIAFLTDYSNIK